MNFRRRRKFLGNLRNWLELSTCFFPPSSPFLIGSDSFDACSKSRTKRINSNISQLNSQLIRARKELQLIESKSLTTPPNQSSSNSIASALTDVILEIPIESEISSMLDQVEGLRSSYDELREKEDCVERKLTLLKESKKQEIIANWNGESRRSLERIQVLESKVSELSKKSSSTSFIYSPLPYSTN